MRTELEIKIGTEKQIYDYGVLPSGSVRQEKATRYESKQKRLQ